MKNILGFVFLSLLLPGISFSQVLQTRPEENKNTPVPSRGLANNDPVYLQLRSVRVGRETIMVKDFTLKRDAGIFRFATGAFHLLEPVNGKITGAVFVGQATLTLVPPGQVEQRYLSILTKGQQYEEQFTSALFRFTDGTEAELRKGAVADGGSASGDGSSLLDEIRQQLKKTLRENLDVRLLQDVMSSQPGGKFVAFIKGKKYSDKTIYDVDPHGVVCYYPDPGPIFSGGPVLQEFVSLAPEEVALITWDVGHFGIWSSFHFSREYATGTASSDEQNGTFAISHQKLDTFINKRGRLSATAQTTITALQNGVRVLALDLFPTLRVSSVSGENGQELHFIQEEHEQDADFAIILPRELNKGESYTITTKYEGKDAITSEGSGNYYPLARQNWYPSLGFGHYSDYEMTFHIPKGMKMAATGNRLKEVDEGDENLTQWVSIVPQAVSGFNFGSFKREQGKPNKQPYFLETYANPEIPDILKGLQFAANGTGMEAHPREQAPVSEITTLGMMKKAMAEAQIAIDLYTDFFGEASYKRLALTQQTAPNYGQSWPGLVYLPLTYFLDTTIRHQIGLDNPRGYFTVVGPHEIAHQWWGHTVGWNSYRDQWMSEGFADMSASIFVQAVYCHHNLDVYHKFWADERWLLTASTRQGKRPIDIGPVTLGYRLDNAKTGFSAARQLIYPKGAYILQMVRFMLQDTRAQDPDIKFKTMMRDFTRTYANRVASTEDFKAVVEKYMTSDMDIAGNHKMDWFFNEYVYGTEYPSYRFEHSFSTNASGDLVLDMKITQSGVSQSFAMPVPVYLEFGNGRVFRLGTARLIGSTTFEQHVPLKGMKDKPKRAVLAYYDDVLGDIENK